MTPAEAVQERTKPFSPGLLGLRFLEATPDLVKAEIDVRPELCTVLGIMHGGAIMAMADTLGAVGTVMNLPPGAGTTTIESKTNFFAPVPCPGKAIATCTPIHKGKRTLVWQTRIETEAGKLAALVTQTQMVLQQ
ncbi:MAG: PaaI family thioesterase [Candidatus Hydrogenedentota bacterium]